MKITAVLCKQNYHRKIKNFWKTASKIAVTPLQISPELQKLGIKIHNARDIVKEPNSYDIIPEKNTTALLDPNDYSLSRKKFYLFNNEVQITEEEAQVLCLTKTTSYSGLPTILNSLVGLEHLTNQDELVQHCISQALIKDSQLVRLPRYVDPKQPAFVFLREYGILYERQAGSLMKKLSFLSEAGCGKYPGSHSRNKILDAFSEVVLERGNDMVVFQVIANILITAKQPLKAFSSPSEVETTKDIALPSIYPIKPTLDLEQHEISPAKQVDDIHLLDSLNMTSSHLHTLHIVHKSYDSWSPVQKLSRAVVGCFTYAAQEAKRLYGKDVKELPEPVSIQCVYSDLTTVGFMAYQLNTLDLCSDDGIKNQVWIDEQQTLCGTRCRKNCWEILEITNYNETVFPKMLAMYLNGAHPESL